MCMIYQWMEFGVFWHVPPSCNAKDKLKMSWSTVAGHKRRAYGAPSFWQEGLPWRVGYPRKPIHSQTPCVTPVPYSRGTLMYLHMSVLVSSGSIPHSVSWLRQLAAVSKLLPRRTSKGQPYSLQYSVTVSHLPISSLLSQFVTMQIIYWPVDDRPIWTSSILGKSGCIEYALRWTGA
jgi:hypothetical protein